MSVWARGSSAPTRLQEGFVEIGTNIIPALDGRGRVVQQEVDHAETLRAPRHKTGASGGGRQSKSGQELRKRRKTIASLEKSVARLDAERQEKRAMMAAATDPDKAMKLHREIEDIESKLSAAEDQWLSLQEEGAG